MAQKPAKKTAAAGCGKNPPEPGVGMIDLILGYTCNSACIFCTADGGLRSTAMTSGEALGSLDRAISTYRPGKVRFGGGEPTVRRDLPALVRFARAGGVPLVSIQTNGFMLAYRDYLARLKDSGLGKVNISVRTMNARLYAGLTGVPDSFRLATAAVSNAMGMGIPVEMDVLVIKPVLRGLAGLTEHFLAEGVLGINFWFVSAEGRALRAADGLVPTMSEAASALGEIFDMHPSAALKSFYIPYCFFPHHIRNVWHPISEKTLVITPGDRFMLERGRIDLGEKTARCRGCMYLKECFGVRRNYLDLKGDAEISPVRRAVEKF
jgi:cyclic pyranopterin phosphate synthase